MLAMKDCIIFLMTYYDTIMDWTLLKTKNKLLCEGECVEKHESNFFSYLRKCVNWTETGFVQFFATISWLSKYRLTFSLEAKSR